MSAHKVKRRKWIPYAFLLLLFILIVLFAGIEYGKAVEKANKQISYVLSITPTQKPSPTQAPSPTPALIYKTYQNEYCGIEFLYPDNLTQQSATTSATISQEEEIIIEITCQGTATNSAQIVSPSQKEQDILTFQNQEIPVIISQKNKMNTYEFTYSHPITQQTLVFRIREDIFPLVERTIEFTQ